MLPNSAWWGEHSIIAFDFAEKADLTLYVLCERLKWDAAKAIWRECALEFEDERLAHMTVQMSRETWLEMEAMFGERTEAECDAMIEAVRSAHEPTGEGGGGG